MYRSSNWENERYIYEKLKQEKVFKYWKKVQFDCQTGRCAWCGKPMQYRYAETDHVKPLYYGGTSNASNLVLCHHNCNVRKSTRTDYTRPDWIQPNRYDVGVNGRYQALRANLESSGNYIGAKREQTINPKSYSGLYASSRKPNSKQKNNIARTIFKALYVFTITLIGLVSVLCLLKLAQKNSIDNSPSGQSAATRSNSTPSDPDSRAKQLAQSILASYTNFYNNYVAKYPTSWSLPKDQYDCVTATWQHSGCTLSDYGGAKTPDGYTYSVNSLENKKVFKQNGTIPHASKTNAALYKKARCGENGNVVGGTEAKNAAVVIQLSDDSYYCVEN